MTLMLASVTDAEEAETAAATIVDAGASYVQLSLYAHSAQEDCERAELVGRAA
jgi:hypothetical protein